MSCAAIAGTSFLPLLARVVLGTAFLSAGWHHCFQETSFSPAELRTLEGVVSVPVALVEEAQTAPAPAAEATSDAGGEATTDDSSHGSDAAASSGSLPAPIGPFAGASETSQETAGSVNRAAAERIALTLRDAGFEEWSEPLAWATAVFQLVGGALLVLGLLTRFWALCALAMLGVAFWLGPVETAGMFDQNPLSWFADPASFQEMYMLAAGCVLAFGLMWTGSGSLAIDRVLKPRNSHATATSQTSDMQATADRLP